LREVRAAELIEEVKSEMRNLCEESGLAFIWKVEPGIFLRTDPVKLKVILKNLIGNAVKFTEKGNVTVEVHRRDSGIGFSVTDTGIGIAPEEFQIIFEPFRQAENPLTRKHGGAGTGLYMAKRLAELLGGIIELESEAGKGSTFRFLMPKGHEQPD
jgi:signal transduction histidine kinase